MVALADVHDKITISCVFTMKILLLGSGGREHALAWKLAQSPLVERIWVCPGNGGIASLPKVTNVESVSGSDYPGLVDLAVRENVSAGWPSPQSYTTDTDLSRSHW
jgi:phosphoribosylamine--glycine ligase / phosphoribosylformylglycinamidine cyclo-ligase